MMIPYKQSPSWNGDIIKTAVDLRYWTVHISQLWAVFQLNRYKSVLVIQWQWTGRNTSIFIIVEIAWICCSDCNGVTTEEVIKMPPYELRVPINYCITLAPISTITNGNALATEWLRATLSSWTRLPPLASLIIPFAEHVSCLISCSYLVIVSVVMLETGAAGDDLDLSPPTTGWLCVWVEGVNLYWLLRPAASAEGGVASAPVW